VLVSFASWVAEEADWAVCIARPMQPAAPCVTVHWKWHQLGSEL